MTPNVGQLGWVRTHARLLGSLGFIALVGLLAAALALAVRPSSRNSVATVDTAASQPNPSASTSTSVTTAPAPATTAVTASPLARNDGKTSAQRLLESAFVVSNADLQPKSIVASGSGLFFAQNMMYRHNMMVFDRAGALVAKIADDVDLAAFGVVGGVKAQGAPVEAVFTRDGSSVYVSNYKMYGPGYNPVADDSCGRGKWDDSYVYKINTKTFSIDKVIPTGSVPKFMAITPDGAQLLVSNWCGFDLTIIDTATDVPITRVNIGSHPRGIAVTKDSRYAYVSVMGESKIVKVDLGKRAVVSAVGDAGSTPRHLLLSPDDQFLYVSNNHQNSVRKIDLSAGREVGTAATGTEPRTMAMSDDGESLYVVNYQDGTISKVRTADMKILQTEQSGVHPVGVTYDSPTRQVWVANYTGSLHVFIDK